MQLTSYAGNLIFSLESNFIQNDLRRLKRKVEHREYDKPTVGNYIREVPNNGSWSGNANDKRGSNDVPSARRNYPGSHSGAAFGPRVLNLTGEHGVFIVVSCKKM